MQFRSQKDFYSGLMFLIVGVAFAVLARNYNVGTGARMGPGYFPQMLGVLLAIFGAIITFKSFTSKIEGGDRIGSFAWRPLCYIIGANIVFGILLGGLPSIKLPAMGLIAGIYALTFISSLAGDTFKVKEVFILSTALAIGSYLAFIVLLKLQFPVWPTFITG
jgi:Tripartite tricarboxylate transporter TctB family